MVCVVPSVNVMVCVLVSSRFNSANVLEPVTVLVAPVKLTVAPLKSRLLVLIRFPLQFIVAVLAARVRLEPSYNHIAQFIVDEPKLIVFDAASPTWNLPPSVTVLPFVFKVPLVK